MSVHTGLERAGAVRDRRSARPRRCELCGTPVAARHGHVADTGRRGLLCSCRACFLLCTRWATGEARYRAVPERYLRVPGHPAEGLDWPGLGIPAGFAFFVRRGTRVTAFQPGPAGPAEAVLPPGELDPWLAAAEPDVEAIVVRGTECYLVPVDACYRLAGTVRRYWTGHDGGREMREQVGALFEEIARRARPPV
ncbi:DUF5947 family protein [Amycolatopsis sp. OK19-0408]|uniref:DUF5947 family protein n=1 Tax=Amycolatopsis iheyensis TaxID=2945988 RepID=A0A9X2NC66_9PSEU|nr:DUF5947 family protein [Amycolatopsis iheyensis]MCR6485112.1 DUF5947 family protein [Amycolatopsis iheyensis]